MGYLPNQPRKTCLALFVLQAMYCLPAYTAGFQINEVSPGLQGDALAGAAAARDDVSAMFINPATLATLTENQAYIGASEIMPSISMSNGSAVHTVNVPGTLPPSSISAVVQGQTYQNNISPSAFVPDAYVSWRFTDKVVGGLALVGPFGLKTNYVNDSVLRFAADYSSIKTININPALAYMVNDKLSLGAGVQAQYTSVIFSNFNGPYTGYAPIDNLISATNPTYLKANNWGLGFTLGMLYKPDEKTRIGLGYRSPVSDNLRGHGQQYTSPGNTVPAPSVDFLFNAETSVFGHLKTPDVLTLSAAHDLADWTLKATAQLNFWSTIQQLSIDMPEAFATNSTIPLKWKNAWFGSLGAEYHATPLWTFRGGLAYDQTPTSDTYRDPRIPDANRVWLNVGASYVVNKKISIDGAYAHIFMQNQVVNVTQASGTNPENPAPLEINQVHANYKGHADVVALALRYKF
ncbi:OmpP1/FadL family transporter [Legionella sp. CNM-4043-24]|uniref:OmpP1/FadL family transporter n=1 Tax=Legionella sp. CNM-4043-24 TaxID=3421646 RepID=UPI00403A82E1